MRKLADYLAANSHRRVVIGRERLRQILREHEISFQRTRTWKESTDPDWDAKLDRIEEVTSQFPDRCSPSTSSGRWRSGPATARLGAASAAGPAAGDLPPHPRRPLLPRLLQPRRRPALGRHPPPQGRRPHPGRAQVDPGRPPGRRPDLRDPGQPVRAQDPGRSGPGRPGTRSSCASPRPTRPGPTRSRPSSGRCARSSSPAPNHPNHTALTRRLQAYLRWRNANARHPDVLAAQRRERARVRSERQRRWGRPRPRPPDQPGERLWSPH